MDIVLLLKDKGFTFDAAAALFWRLIEKMGIMRKILKDLGIDKKLSIKDLILQILLLHLIIKYHFWNDLEKTINEFQEAFPGRG